MTVGILDEDALSGFGALLKQQAAHEKGREDANAEAAKWKEGDRHLEEKRRRANAADWYAHYLSLAETFRARAAEYERQAEELCQKK